MKRITFLVFTFWMFPQFLLAQVDTWENVEDAGFGSVDNSGINEFIVFKDTLYAAVARTGPGIATIWRSGSGDDNTWSRVDYDTLTSTVKGIPSMNTDTIDGGYMWIQTGNPTMGSQVYRTSNGRDWIPISERGFGDTTLWSPTPNMVLYQGSGDSIPYLYSGAGTHGGAASSVVVRTPYNNTTPSNWTELIDFSQRDPDCTQITYFYVWNGTLYFGGNGDSLLYQSTDGVTFTANTGVGADFGLPSNRLIAGITEFNGYLYCSTLNPTVGGRLYRSNDGQTWTDMSSGLPGLGPEHEELHHLDTGNNYLWATPYTNTAISSGIPVWRSADGVNFVQSNVDGFSNPDNDGENPCTIGFQGQQYWGGPNHTLGGQIFRTTLINEVAEQAASSCIVSLSPNPVTSLSQFIMDASCPDITEVEIYDLSGRLVHSEQPTIGKTIQLDRSHFEPGIFLYRLFGDKGFLSGGKFIIE